MSNLYVQYGCGMSSPQGWKNFDASPTLRLQQLPLIGNLLKQRMHIAFPDNVLQGDIIRGLPGIAENSADGVYCSHVLEHLTYEDFLIAVRNTYRILKPGGIFRCVVPDLEKAAREYVEDLGNHDQEANAKFLQKTRLGKTHRRRGIKGLLQNTYGNSDHLFMWDTLSLSNELYRAGFSYVRPATFNDSEDEMFKLVESEGRFRNAVALEARK